MIILNSDLIQTIHDLILKNERGLSGNVRDISGMVSRIDQHIYYSDINDIFEVGALYVEAIAQGHVFNDANKRTAFLSLFVFLQLNEYHLTLKYDDAVETMVKIAKKELTREEIEDWIKKHSFKNWIKEIFDLFKK